MSVTTVVGRGLFLLAMVALTGSVRADIADRSWHKFQQANGVELQTDIDVEVAVALLEELTSFDVLVDRYMQPFAEIAHEIAPELIGNRIDPAGTDGLRLVIMDRRRDFTKLFHPRHFAAFTLPTLHRTTLVVGPRIGTSTLREHLLHEYVHFRLRRDVPGGLPLWFEEGLATYLSQVQFSAPVSGVVGDRDVALGRWPLLEFEGIQLEKVRSLRKSMRRAGNPMRLAKLLEHRTLSGMRRAKIQSYYLTSHALVRYIYAQPDISLPALAASLATGDTPFPEAVGFKLRQAERSIGRHYYSAKPASRHFSLAVPEAVAIVRSELTPNEVRRTLAETALSMNPAASAELYSQLALAEPNASWPFVGESYAWRLQDKTERAGTALAAAQKLAPDDAMVLLEQAATGTSGCIVKSSEHCPEAWRVAMLDLRDALDADPNNFEAIYRLGIAHLYMGQPGEAQGYLQVAWQRVPWSPRVNFFIGESLRLSGDTRARWYLTNAQRWAVSPYYRHVSAAALRLLPDDADKLVK